MMFGHISTSKKRKSLRAPQAPLDQLAKKPRGPQDDDDSCIESQQVLGERRLIRKISSREKARAAKIWGPTSRSVKVDDLASQKTAKSGGGDPYFTIARQKAETSRAGNGGQASFAVPITASTRARVELSGSGGGQRTTSAAQHEHPERQRPDGITVTGQRGATGLPTFFPRTPSSQATAKGSSVVRAGPGSSTVGSRGGGFTMGADVEQHGNRAGASASSSRPYLKVTGLSGRGIAVDEWGASGEYILFSYHSNPSARATTTASAPTMTIPSTNPSTRPVPTLPTAFPTPSTWAAYRDP
jgi:hypothetical protein